MLPAKVKCLCRHFLYKSITEYETLRIGKIVCRKMILSPTLPPACAIIHVRDNVVDKVGDIYENKSKDKA